MCLFGIYVFYEPTIQTTTLSLMSVYIQMLRKNVSAYIYNSYKMRLYNLLYLYQALSEGETDVLTRAVWPFLCTCTLYTIDWEISS